MPLFGGDTSDEGGAEMPHGRPAGQPKADKRGEGWWTPARRLALERAHAARRKSTADIPAPRVTVVEPSSSAPDSNLADLPEGKVQHWSKEDLAIFASAGLALIVGITTLAGSKLNMPELATTPLEATAIAGPLTRLVARRIKVPAAMRGDAADGLALASALSAYVVRVYAVLAQRAHEERTRRSNAVYNPAASPAATSTTSTGPVPAGPVAGVGAAAAANGSAFDATQFFPPANRAA